MKTTTTLTFGALFVLALAGCTTPETGETESGCTPLNATVEWGEASEGDVELIGVQLLEYTDNASRSTLETRQLSDESGFPDDALAELGVTESQLEAWHAGLIERALDSGAVGEGFVASTAIAETGYVELTTPEDGRFVVSVMAPVVAVPVTIACDGFAPVTGDVVGVYPDQVEAIPLKCVPELETEPGDSLESRTAREYCAKA